MKTIENLLEYDLKEEEVEGLLIGGIINGCGAKNNFSFDLLLKDNISHLPMFEESKKLELLCDLKRICYEHDIDFRFQKGFIKSNWRMARKVYGLLHWLPFKYKLSFALIVFIGLCKYGRSSYNLSK